MTPHLPNEDQLAAALGRPPADESGRLEQLRARLADEAGRAGLVELTHRTFDSPVGPLLVAASGRGVARVAFEVEDHDAVLDELAGIADGRILAGGGATDAVARQLEEYFEGRRRDLDVPVDLRLVGGFRSDVVRRLRDIPSGSTWTYAQLADAAGRPRAVRAAASACANNPVPIVLPCHRVVRSDGGLGGYLGGVEAKAALLELEATRR